MKTINFVILLLSVVVISTSALSAQEKLSSLPELIAKLQAHLSSKSKPSAGIHNPVGYREIEQALYYAVAGADYRFKQANEELRRALYPWDEGTDVLFHVQYLINIADAAAQPIASELRYGTKPEAPLKVTAAFIKDKIDRLTEIYYEFYSMLIPQVIVDAPDAVEIVEAVDRLLWVDINALLQNLYDVLAPYLPK